MIYLVIKHLNMAVILKDRIDPFTKMTNEKILLSGCYWIKGKVFERRFLAAEFAKSMEVWQIICSNER